MTSKQPYEKWQITIIDRASRQTLDRKKYVIENQSKLEEIIDDLSKRLDDLKVYSTTVEFQVKFMKFVKGMSA